MKANITISIRSILMNEVQDFPTEGDLEDAIATVIYENMGDWFKDYVIEELTVEFNNDGNGLVR